ncbi:MAG: AMP-binding protein, partial [Actinobacteria bacterium]|nr:AMP-binding protein [Actinomycetota bacterium]
MDATVSESTTTTTPYPHAGDGRRVSRSELTPLSFLRRAATVHADRTAIAYGDRRVDYSELAQRVGRLAAALRAAGLRKSDRVAVLSPNTPALVEAHFGVPAAGGVLVAVNTRLNEFEARSILDDCTPSVVLVDREFEGLVPQDLPSAVRVVAIDDTGLPDDPYEAFLAEARPDGRWSWPADEQEPIALNYTSGT